MKTLYIMRHGETLFNKQGKNQGWCDAPLTKLGIDQARAASFYFVDSGVRPDHFYSSTSERACDTLEIVMQEAWGQVLPYTRDKGLKEFNFGEYEGKDSYLNPGPPFGDYFVRFGGDSDTSLCERMVSTLTRIMSDPANEVVLATSHGAACANFLRHWKDYNVEQYRPGIKNCTIFQFDYDEASQTFSCQRIITPDLERLEA